MTSSTASVNATAVTTAAPAGWEPNVMLMVSACGVLVFVAIGMTVVLLLDYFKRKKERQALAEEQVNLEEAFGGTANTPAANIYGVLWGDGARSTRKTKATAEDEKTPLMAKSGRDDTSSKASNKGKEEDDSKKMRPIEEGDVPEEEGGSRIKREADQ